jgi:class 3 adenylate cyclase/predicted ATPase
MQIAQWLETFGMSQYAESFAKNHIDFSVLCELDDADLRELGVVLGDRRKILRAIRELQVGSNEAVRVARASAAQDTAERRQLTVMFCDLVGSTALSARLDPEDMREIVAAYHRCCANAVQRFGGFVAKYMGDGVLIYFGYPLAHEHDAEHAVQTGLALIEAVPSLVTPAGASLHARIGIATGLVVVGDLIGSGEAQERGVVGETPNLAARLQGVAGPDMVVIDDATRKLLGRLFELRDLGANDLKGIPGPVPAWAALRASSAESRFEALRAAGLIPLIGREAEFEVVADHWAIAARGRGRMLLLSGEAGIGKSRLIAALLERLAAEPHGSLRWYCSPQHSESALYPIIGQIERAAGLAHTDSPKSKLDKLDALLARQMPADDVALIADLLQLANDGRYPLVSLTPQQRRTRTLEVLVVYVASLGRAAPLLMILEDAHWIDPTSQELLGRIADRIAGLPALLLVTFRPEFKPPWIEQPNVATITLDRLSPRDVSAMIDRVAGDKRLPANVHEDILERTDGIPLFVEEMTKAVLEAEGESEARRTAAGVPSAGVAVPASLHASLMARLDRLGSAKEVAQIGSVIGREFSYALLAAAAARLPEAELASALDRLAAAGLLLRQGRPPNATYMFNHALVQDAAYGTLLRESRRALHRRVAETFKSQYPEFVERQPELVAHHYTEAGVIEESAPLWGKAGLHSLTRSALIEAAEQLSRALAQISTLPSTPPLRREQIKLQVGLANALIHMKGHASPETKAAFEQARSMIERAELLGEQPDDPLVLFSVLYGFWVGSRMAFKGDVSLELATQFQSLAEKQRSTIPLMIGHFLMGVSKALVGRSAEARPHLDRSIVLYDPVEHRHLMTRFGHDVRVSALSWRALVAWLLGDSQAAFADAEFAIKDAHDIGHAATSMFALSHTALMYIHGGKQDRANMLAEELIKLAGEKGTLYWQSYGLLLRGWLQVLNGQAALAIPLSTSAVASMRSTGATAYAPWYLSYLAHAHAEIGQFDDAWRCLDEALAVVQSTEESWCEADIHRIGGDIALLMPDRDAARAEAQFERALIIARRQQAKPFELRAAISMARLWSSQGKQQQAQELLQSLHAGSSDGIGTGGLAELAGFRENSRS